LAYLSIQARKILDEAGFPDASIVASNDLDENIITSLKQQDAQINVWGIGTKLVTAYDQPALGGVYKIAAMRKDDGGWDYKVKLSEQVIKVSNPGVLQVRRFYQDGEYIADMIFNEIEGVPEVATIIDPMDATRQRDMPADAEFKDLLQPLFKAGELVYQIPSIDEVKAHAAAELENFHAGVKRFVNQHSYPVGLEKNLSDYKYDLIRELRKRKQS
jgi:nicotinate phosphoribosyltransferase